MISILIPVFNTPAEFLSECFDSIYSQTFKEFEVVVVDNGSTNIDTQKFLMSEFKKRQNFLLHHVERQEYKRNISVALNYGLKECKYELVARMDGDDIMIKTRLKEQLKYMLKNKHVDVCGGQMEVFDSWSNTTQNITNLSSVVTIENYKESDWHVNHPTVMFRKTKILKLNGYQENCDYFSEDLDLWVRCLKNGYRIHNLNKILIKYRIHDHNLSKLDGSNAIQIKKRLDKMISADAEE
jgi:glycosyltransferase involved in cell wall biosynthesis